MYDALHRRILLAGIVVAVSATMWAAALRIAVLCSPAIPVANEAAYYYHPEQEDLFMAAEEGDDAYVKWRILQDRTAISSRDAQKFTLLHVAASSCHPQLARVLLHLGAQTGARDILGDTPLHHAVRKSCPGVAAILVGAGASAAARNTAGVTPLLEAHQYWPDGSEMLRILRGSSHQAAPRTGGKQRHESSR